MQIWGILRNIMAAIIISIGLLKKSLYFKILDIFPTFLSLSCNKNQVFFHTLCSVFRDYVYPQSFCQTSHTFSHNSAVNSEMYHSSQFCFPNVFLAYFSEPNTSCLWLQSSCRCPVLIWQKQYDYYCLLISMKSHQEHMWPPFSGSLSVCGPRP